jgi:hypothetical protein
LSETIILGLPRRSINTVSSRAARRPEIELSGLPPGIAGDVITDMFFGKLGSLHLSVLQKAGL